MSASTSPKLQDDEKFALMKFRRSVADVLGPEHDDFFLLRWLRARSWNPVEAEKMLRASVKWRETWSANEIHNWVEPKILLEMCPHGLAGYDKEGSPILIVPFAGMDMWGLLHTVSRSDIVRITLKMLEKYLKIAYQQSLTHGPLARTLVVIFDMDDFNFKQYAWRPAAEVVISLIKMYEANYPEILKHCFIINAPKIFSFAFNIVKKFLAEYTISKIHIYKRQEADKRKWLPPILERIDPENLPAYYGGTMTDEDGNPKCLSKICWGGKVPKHLYISKEENFNNNSEYVDAVIKKGHRIKLEFICADPGCFLKWEFRTFDHDIKFGVRCINNTNDEKTDEVQLRRVSSHQVDEVGFIACQSNCTYKVLFDNSYSFFINKKIRYSVFITTPLEEFEKGANSITENQGEIENGVEDQNGASFGTGASSIIESL